MFSLIACCPTLNILLENDVKNEVYFLEGVYTFQGFSNGMDYWVDDEGEHALWYLSSASNYYWLFDHLDVLGSFTAAIYSSSNTLEKKCPNNEGYVWNWMYFSHTTNSFVETNDVYIKCVDEGNCK